MTATETEEGRRWAEAKIKMLTGADMVSARFMRQDFFDYVPQFKLMIAGNHKPGAACPDEPPTEANQHQTRCTASGFTTDPVDRITAARLINTPAKARHLVHDPG